MTAQVNGGAPLDALQPAEIAEKAPVPSTCTHLVPFPPSPDAVRFVVEAKPAFEIWKSVEVAKLLPLDEAIISARPDAFACGVVVGDRNIEKGANAVEEPMEKLPGKVIVIALETPKASKPPPIVSPPVLVEYGN